jgi:hypothetical protein
MWVHVGENRKVRKRGLKVGTQNNTSNNNTNNTTNTTNNNITTTTTTYHFLMDLW